MGGIKDRLGELSWLGDAYVDQGWVEVGEEPVPQITAAEVNTTIKQILKNTAWAVASDNLTMTKGQRADWLEFRQALRDIPLQAGFPTDIVWPTEPT